MGFETMVGNSESQESALTQIFRLVRCFVAEFLGTALICYMSVIYQGDTIPGPVVAGLTLTWDVWVFGPVSGSHVNPVVSLMMLFTRRIGFVQALIYIVAQLLGSMGGAWIGTLAVPIAGVSNTLGMTTVSANTTIGQAIGLEIVATSILLIMILAAVDELRPTPWSQSHFAVFPIIFGITITLLAALVGKFTGASMNPARSFGPAVVNNNFSQLWIYIVGPFVGALLGTVLYEFLLAEGVCIKRLKAWFTDSSFDRSRDYRISENDHLTKVK